MVFSRQFVDVLNPFIGCQQNWWIDEYHVVYVNNLKSSVQITLK
jgi:hypothetical protein